MQNRKIKISPKKNSIDVSKIFDAFESLFTIEVFMASAIGMMVIIGFLFAANHLTSTVKGHVTASVVDRNYSPPYITQEPIYVTDSEGNQTLVGFNSIHHPEEWHVTWGYMGMRYTESTSHNWGGLKIGDLRGMVVRVGGVFHSEYLWSD